MFLRVLRVILFPFSVIFNGITRLRNHLYNIGSRPSVRFEVLTISVGNLNTGGSGKTPMVEYLIRLLKDRYRIATLSRGYGRLSSGFRLASPIDNAQTLGDEPYQLFRKFGDSIKVAVGEERALAIPNILQVHEDINCVLLDDAFQHRRVIPHLSILVTDFSKPFFRDFVLPTGNLRESRVGAKRADIIVVTKCDVSLLPEMMEYYRKEIGRYAPGKPVYFATVDYVPPVAVGHHLPLEGPIVLVTGIANTSGLRQHVLTQHEVVRHFHFADHHRFTHDELSEIVRFAAVKKAAIVTSEKDMARLQLPAFSGLFENVRLYYLPISMRIINNGPEFDAVVLDKIQTSID